MRAIFTVLFIIPLAVLAQSARERTVSGRLTGSDGSPLPGVNIVVKGTAVGTVTDVNGNYSLNAPIGSVLVFSFIGMQPREVLVTEKNLNPVTSRTAPKTRENVRSTYTWSPSILQDSSKSTEGVTVLTDKTPVYIADDNYINPANILAIRPISRMRTALQTRQPVSSGGYRIKTNNDPIRTGFGLQFSSAIGLETITRLPEVQQVYAQGQSEAGGLHWRGADQGEIFSWGPLLRTLEYDGSSYPYDRNGKLVTAGTGNGTPAGAYDPKTFFKTGFSTDHDLMLSIPGPRRSTLLFDVGRKTRSGVIPNSLYARNNLSLQIKKFRLAQRLNGDGMITYNYSHNTLANRGANLAMIMGSVFQTPPSFDNANGLSERQALLSKSTYRLQDGTVRSYAPGLRDNPYGLVNELPDTEKWKRFLATASFQYAAKTHFKLTVNESFDKQWNDVTHGIAPGLSAYPEGRLTNRREVKTYFNTIVSPTYNSYWDGNEITASVSYQFNFLEHDLTRSDGFGYADETWSTSSSPDSLHTIHRMLNRTAHEILFNVQYRRDWMNVRLANRSYFSDTAPAETYTNFFPTVSATIDLSDLVSLYPLNELKIYGTISRTLREGPLVYSNWSYRSTTMEASDYYRYFESSELYFPKGLLPETEQKLEAGIKAWIFDRVNLDFSYFNNHTEDFIAPVRNGNEFTLTNAARVHNYGTSLSASYTHYYSGKDWGVTLRWSKYNSIAEKLYGSPSYIPIAGFASTASVLAEGKPVGALYGTTFMRNENGQQIIGDDGFPIANPSLSMIGNPIPDWTASLESFVQLNRFRVSCLFDFKKGGDVWNGTKAALNYSGRSAVTADQRTISGYVFEGVDSNGQPNTLPVSFYDPSKPVTENRWVRYGYTGVSEENIEDASWIRLQELSVSYTTQIRGSKIRDIRFSLVGRNLFLITPYSGVDPSAALFGSSNATGLDLFNVPATRSYSAQITFKI